MSTCSKVRFVSVVVFNVMPAAAQICCCCDCLTKVLFNQMRMLPGHICPPYFSELNLPLIRSTAPFVPHGNIGIVNFGVSWLSRVCTIISYIK